MAKIVGVCQPTVSRIKKSLLNEGIIEGVVAVPNFNKIGYELMALTFVKIKAVLASEEERKQNFEKVKKWMSKQDDVIFCASCRGLGFHSFFISLHKNYKAFDAFMKRHDVEIGHELLIDLENILVNLDDDQILKPFNFKYLGENAL
ncbi:MAG: Lrp/AsnC family transcriptional regulator [Candidatus Bathyarchaeota archaeon]|nr:Lrp/AsnC family transcriptional regulator [Candidatus Bathyarchaeum tardum]WGM90250.1 MAG: Lrp/AsnC family transcriptional regulator [Candidatus Bathyarchaeum tardum]